MEANPQRVMMPPQSILLSQHTQPTIMTNPAPVTNPPNIPKPPAPEENEIISRQKLQELVQQIAPSIKLDPEVEEVIYLDLIIHI